MKESSAFYILRKLGSKQKGNYIVSAYLPSVLVFIVFTLLVFITVFVHSMALQTNEIVEVLGSGSLIVYGEYDSDIGLCDSIKTGQALGYGKTDTLLLNLKGVDNSYFNDRRRQLLKLDGELQEGRSIVLSKSQAAKLDLNIGDRFVIALYESEKERIRPVNCTITGLYSTGYGEFDDNLVYVPLSLLDGDISTEILLDKGENNMSLYESLLSSGYNVRRYQMLYRDLLDNVLLSVNLINIIVGCISLAAGFFALNIATEYISRDKKDIKGLYLMGFSNKDIGYIYRNLSFFVTLLSAFFGGLLGVILSYTASFVFRNLDPLSFPVLANYVTNFKIEMPYLKLLSLYIGVAIISYISLYFSLRQFGKGRKVLL